VKSETGAPTEGLGELAKQDAAAAGKQLKNPADKNNKEKKEIPAPRVLSDEMLKVFQEQHCAEMFAAALLQNPKIDTFLYGSPLEAGPRGGELNAGALLARGAKRLAENYLAELEALYQPPKPADAPETTTAAPGEGPFEDDFGPLD
jgi:hypothetical protein